MHNPLDISLIVSNGEHARLARGTAAFKKAVILGIDPDDIDAECALALWKTSQSPRSQFNPSKGSRSNYIMVVCSSAICKMIRSIARPNSPALHSTPTKTGVFNNVVATEPFDLNEELVLRDLIISEIPQLEDLTDHQKGVIRALLLGEVAPPTPKGCRADAETARGWLRSRLKAGADDQR